MCVCVCVLLRLSVTVCLCIVYILMLGTIDRLCWWKNCMGTKASLAQTLQFSPCAEKRMIRPK